MSDFKNLPEAIRSPEDFDSIVEFLMRGAQALTDVASAYGFVLTINTSPKRPLAMGNYDMECELRAHHQVYRGQA